jgi:hypothetical protein
MKAELLRRQAELLAYHEANGYLNVRRLPRRTRLVIETSDEIYELEVGTPDKGVVLVASDGFFRRRRKVVVLGSIDPKTGIFLPEIVGYGLKMMLRRPYKGITRTSPILTAKVIGPRDSYEYKMWDDGSESAV